MKTYVISLERSVERNKYIRRHIIERHLDYRIISAVDGALITDEFIREKCNTERVREFRWWLTNGAIGCALSHQEAYDEFLKTSASAAFIIEDDVFLPENILEVLNEVELEIKPEEIILLYYTSFESAPFSRYGSVKLSVGGLYYPMDIRQPITATAYVVGRAAAEGLRKANTPVEATADCWHYFHSKKAFSSLRVHHPSVIDVKNFKSSIDYLKKGSIKRQLSWLINNYKIPILYQVLFLIRKRKLNKMKNFYLTDEISPLYPAV